jgi:ATP-dependent DNA ligase
VIKPVKATTVTPARLPDFVEPRKAKLVESIRPGDWIYEIKLDGYRALALRGSSETRIPSRNRNDLGSKFLEVSQCLWHRSFRISRISQFLIFTHRRMKAGVNRCPLTGESVIIIAIITIVPQSA